MELNSLLEANILILFAYGKKISTKLFEICRPIIIMAIWMQSSKKQPDGSHASVRITLKSEAIASLSPGWT